MVNEVDHPTGFYLGLGAITATFILSCVFNNYTVGVALIVLWLMLSVALTALEIKRDRP